RSSRTGRVPAFRSSPARSSRGRAQEPRGVQGSRTPNPSSHSLWMAAAVHVGAGRDPVPGRDHLLDPALDTAGGTAASRPRTEARGALASDGVLPDWPAGTVAVLATGGPAPHAIPVSTVLRAGPRTIVLALAAGRDSLARLRADPSV